MYGRSYVNCSSIICSRNNKCILYALKKAAALSSGGCLYVPYFICLFIITRNPQHPICVRQLVAFCIPKVGCKGWIYTKIMKYFMVIKNLIVFHEKRLQDLIYNEGVEENATEVVMGGGYSIALQKKDGKVLRIWMGEQFILSHVFHI